MQTESPPQFTARAVLTGVVLGAILTPCNIYSGLKIGWAFNMSIAAGLLAMGFWTAMHRAGAAKPWGILENNINQTTTSSAASIISGGLVAPIPALTILTGMTLGWAGLTVWVFAVSILGVVVAASLRSAMIEREKLPFPAGVATAETLTRIHAEGGDAASRIKTLLGALGLSALMKLALELWLSGWSRLSIGLFYPAWASLRAVLPQGLTFNNLTFAFDPSLLMIGFGAIIGMRAAVSLMIGAVVSWGLLAPYALSKGWVKAGQPGDAWFGELVTWLLWPGVTMIVVSSLTAFAISAARALAKRRGQAARQRNVLSIPYLFILGLVTILITVTGRSLFGLSIGECLIAVGLSFTLAIVSARVTGETGITPVGALGKVTQLSFGVISPGNLSSNLMSANVTGGAAGQCADLMQDLKSGAIIGAAPKLQLYAQAFGVATGALVGSAVYLVLVPDPAAMLITPEWPAPAVATWKAVAEVLAGGIGAIPEGAVTASAIAGLIGFAFAVIERTGPEAWRPWLPSAPAMGLGFVIPAWNAMSMLIGALLALGFKRLSPALAERHTTTIAAGLVAGESLVGVGLALAAISTAF